MIDSLPWATRLTRACPHQARSRRPRRRRPGRPWLLRTLGDDDWTGRRLMAPTPDVAPWSPTWSPVPKTAPSGSVLRRRRYPESSRRLHGGRRSHHGAGERRHQLVERFASLRLAPAPPAPAAAAHSAAPYHRSTRASRASPLAPGLPAGRHLHTRDLWTHAPVDPAATGRPSSPGRPRRHRRPGGRRPARSWSLVPVLVALGAVLARRGGGWLLGSGDRWRSSGPRRSPTCAPWPAATRGGAGAGLWAGVRAPPLRGPGESSSPDRRGSCLPLPQGVEADQTHADCTGPQQDVGGAARSGICKRR